MATGSPPAIETTAAFVTGIAAGAVAGLLKAPFWGSILIGSAGALLTKVLIDRASATPASSATSSA